MNVVRRRSRLVLPLAACLVVALGIWLVSASRAAFLSSRLAIEELIEAQLGRKLTYGKIEGGVIGLTTVLYDVELAGAGAEPQVKLSRVEVRFDLLRAVTSLGEELAVTAVRVQGGVIRVHRDKDGRTDLLEVLKRLPPPEPFLMRAGVVREVRIEGLRVEVQDDVLKRSTALTDISLEADDVRAGHPFDAQARFFWEGIGAEAVISMHMDEVPLNLKLWPLPTGRALLALADIDLGALVTTFALPPLLASGMIDGTVFFEVPRDGKLEAELYALGQATALAGEEPRPVSLDAALALDLVSGRLAIDRFTLVGAGIDATATLLGHVSVNPEIETLSLELTTLDLGLPMRWGLTALDVSPDALVLAGPGRLAIRIAGNSVRTQLELDEARFQIGESFHKRPGDRMRLHFAGGFTPSGIDGELIADMPRNAKVTGTLALAPASQDDVVLVDLQSSRALARPDPRRRGPGRLLSRRSRLGGARATGPLSASRHGPLNAEGASCQFLLTEDCTEKCVPVSTEKVCASRLTTACEGECTSTAEEVCVTTCDETCVPACTTETEPPNCMGLCMSDCQQDCTADCATSDDPGKCRASCAQCCSTHCHDQCDSEPEPACEPVCDTACQGSCVGRASMDCQLSCQSELYTECEETVIEECKDECETSGGAIFCDGQFLSSGGDAVACADELRTELGSDINVSGSGEASGEAEGEGYFGCSGGGQPSHAMFAFLALAGLAAWKRRRRMAFTA